MMDGQIESWVAIYDLGNLSLWTIPYKALGITIQTLNKIYKCRSSKLFVLNASKGFYNAWRIIRKFIEERTLTKLQIHMEINCKELFEQVHPDQLEKRFGGNAPDAEGIFWPPFIPSQNFGVDEGNLCSTEQHEMNCLQNQFFKPMTPHNIEEQKQSSKLSEFSVEGSEGCEVV